MTEDAGTSATFEVFSGGTSSGEGADLIDDAVDPGLRGAGNLLSPTKPSSRNATLSVRGNAPVPANSCGTGRVADLEA